LVERFQCQINVFGLDKGFAFGNVDEVLSKNKYGMTCAFLPFLKAEAEQDRFQFFETELLLSPFGALTKDWCKSYKHRVS
jgi:hypothetical protein